MALARALSDTHQLPQLRPRLAARLAESFDEDRRWDAGSRNALGRIRAGTAPVAAGDPADATCAAAASAGPLGIWWCLAGASKEDAFDFIRSVVGITHCHPMARVAAFGQAFAVRKALLHAPDDLDGPVFLEAVAEMTAWAERQLGAPETCSRLLASLASRLDLFPLDLQDFCDGTGSEAEQSWPFATAMFAREPMLIEATLLSAVNVGGDAASVGALTGGLLGALHGWRAFPSDWRDGLEAREELEGLAEEMERKYGNA
jgi:ADP-ribosyl-[dinitrogen reductase] hydrolase